MSQSISIDDIEVPFESGQTIMDAALAAGIYIPHLCHNPCLKPHGSCKLCSVEVNGRSVSSCTTKAEDGQEIINNSEKLNKARLTITQMLFIEGNHLCPTCEKTGHCTLQAVAYHLGMLDGHFPQFYPKREVDASHPSIMLDRDRCILCELCVRASRDMDGKNVFAISGRGTDSHLSVNSPTGKLVDSNIDKDDLAVHICPVGAILIKEHGYEIPIGCRTFDLRSIAEIDLGDVKLSEKSQHNE
ncbi:MAG: 2Fe-2S iron-sulfur cluster-binding protein [Gammaproteobacteria bacterium]|nr:2Fe-2S iron-sulfur cluster-binding protein [Gammaproteobacteria bacterium]